MLAQTSDRGAYLTSLQQKARALSSWLMTSTEMKANHQSKSVSKLSDNKEKNLNLRIVIDGAMILTLLFFGGVGWDKIGSMQQDISRLYTMNASMQTDRDRMARVEVKVDMLIEQMKHVTEQGDARERR